MKNYCKDCKYKSTYRDHDAWGFTGRHPFCMKVISYEITPMKREKIRIDLNYDDKKYNGDNDCPYFKLKWYKKLNTKG